MKKIILFIFLFLPIQVIALAYPELHYQNAIVYDMTDNQVLYTYNSEEKVDIASLTKIMTTITAIENIKNLDEYVTYTKEMASNVRWDASVAGLKVGDKITYRDLLYASILPSGADATTALAFSTSGSIDSFVEKMNELASKLDLKNTHFVNVTGLDTEDHYSSAEDLLTILKYALSNLLFKEIYTTKNYTLSNGLNVKSTIYAYSKGTTLNTERIIGSKTGFTLGAGLCISVLFNSNQHDMLLITLGAERNESFYNVKDALELITFIDENYQDQILVEKESKIKTIPVINSKADFYEIKASQDISLFLPVDYQKDDIKIEYNGLEELSFHNKLNSKIGTINYYYQERLIASEDVYLKENLKINILKIIYQYKVYIFILIATILSIIISRKRQRKAI